MYLDLVLLQNHNTKFTDRLLKSSKWLHVFSLVKFVQIVDIKMVRKLAIFESELVLFVIHTIIAISTLVKIF